jgi:glycosyltransferase involved in cell wall biosynthesis
MRILVVIPSLLRAGAETQTVDLANGMAAHGHTVHLCCFERVLDQRSRLASTVVFHHLPRRFKYDLSVASRVARIIDAEAIDVVQTVLDIATLYGWLASRISRRQPAVVAAIHTTTPRNRKEELLSRFPYRQIHQRLDALIFVCEAQREFWLERFPELCRAAEVVHNGIDTQRFSRQAVAEPSADVRARLGIPNRAFVFACVAAFRPEKGHDILIDAFSQIEGEAYLVMVGDGLGRRAIEGSVRAKGVSERVRFVGSVDDVRPIVAAADASVLASTAVETFSIAMLESMSLGVPMIAPRIGGLAEAIVDGQSGLLFSPGDRSGLARCMRMLAGDREATVRLGETAAQIVRRCFDADRMVQRTLEVLALADVRRAREPARS